MQQTPQFWEKTVEYAFVISASNAGKLSLALPLAGKPERAAGDAIFGSNASLVLVEFKRSKSETETEKSIFTDYEKAQQQLFTHDGHHFLVYPTLANGPASPLKLVAETYFSRQACETVLECLERGANAKVFRNYLEQLFSLKILDGRSSSGQIGTGALAQVLGVSTNGHLLDAVTLQEFAPDLFPEQQPKADLDTPRTKSPSRNRLG